MSNNIAIKLAELHSSYGIYSKELLTSGSEYSSSNNIISEIKKWPELGFLAGFYETYVECYCDYSNFQKNHKIEQREAKGTDLPYLGENALKAGRPKLFFVFEGSLTNHNVDEKEIKLSITVLSHLWTVNSIEMKKAFINGWWKNRTDLYDNIFNSLKINGEIASNAYVVDAKRIDNVKENGKIIEDRQYLNTELIYEEIEILKPELVICVGNNAKNIVGMNYLKQNTKFHSVRFPKYISKEEMEEVEKSYIRLSEIMEDILSQQ